MPPSGDSRVQGDTVEATGDVTRGAKNVFVVGLDDFNRRKLDVVAAGGQYVFHPLLTIEEVTAGRDWSLDHALETAARQVEAFAGGADALIGYWDFPVSLMVPLLCGRYGLISPSLEGVLKCEHKYWSRIEQRAVAEAHVPPFQAVDPFDDDSVAGISLSYPFWLKPIKSFASHLGFRIRNARDLRAAITALRLGITELGEPFNQFLARAEIPAEVEEIGGNYCIAEGIVSGRQCTLEGFVHKGAVEIYGVVDSIRHANRSTFARYEYPSSLPRAVAGRMAEIAERVMRRIGLDNSAFNIEFFWDAPRKKIWLLEINPRMSQSHGDLFEKVDGIPHHKVVVDLALGRRPEWRKGGGEFPFAGKFFLRRFRDAVVTGVPTKEEIATVMRQQPGTLIEINARPGMRLSDLDPQDQDSYSYIYGLLFVGAGSRRALMDKYRQCVEALPFEFAGEQPVAEGESPVSQPNIVAAMDLENGEIQS